MTRTVVTERNDKAKLYVHEKLALAKKLSKENFSELSSDISLNKTLDDLIIVKANGFRGVVLTAIVGLHINPEYDPLNKFYSCNPRSIFEKGIWYALNENNVPCGKSDPLNVAKNINELNESWVEGRRPQKSAQAAVDFLRILMNENEKKENLIDYFFFKLVAYSTSIASIEVTNIDDSIISNQEIGHKLAQFVLSYPESGTVPQLVIGKIAKFLFNNSTRDIEGENESVFGTNTTSKKPADIWFVDDGKPTNLYEITVKKIDLKRLDDCIHALHQVKMINKPVTFICRLPEDVRELDLTETNNFSYKGKSFDFVDISAFIKISTSLLTSEQISQYIGEMSVFIQDVNRPIKTKHGWNDIFSK